MKNKPNPILLLICVAFAVTGYFRLNDTSLYTDSTRYVIWGTSFAHGHGFIDDTQPDPERYVVNAPLYSVVLAPALLFFPNSLAAAKFWTLIIGVCALVLFFFWLKRRLGPTQALIGTLILACNPLMIVMATEAMSEMCFLALTFFAMIILEDFETDEKVLSRNSVSLLVILSFLPLLREVSIALVGAVIIVLLRKRQYRHAIWFAVGTAVVAAAWIIRNVYIVGVPPTSQDTNVSFILGHFVTPANSSIVRELIQRMVANIQGFYVFTVSLLMYPFPQALIVDPHQLFRIFFKSLSTAKYILPFVLLPFLLTGILSDMRRSYKGYIALCFCVFYALIIVVYPVQDIRFLLPLLPFGIYYVLSSLNELSKLKIFQNRQVAIALGSVAAMLIIIPNCVCDLELVRTNWEYRHSPDELFNSMKKSGVSKEMFVRPWQPFGNWITEHLPDSAVIASTFKELSLFVGDRKILEINYGVPLPMFERFLRDYGVAYVLSARKDEPTVPYQFIMAESRRYWFEPVYSLNGLVLYKVHSSHIDANPSAASAIANADTNSLDGILHAGRSSLLRGDYADAILHFRDAASKGANPAMVRFQMTVAYAMAGDKFEASRSLEQLYRLPQSTSYIPSARLHLQAMEKYSSSINSANLYQRSTQLLDVAAFYWNFGYRTQAYSLLRNIIQKDSAYFWGLLWGWDYAKEIGDQKQANAYLRQLELIERENPVVRGFRTITAVEDSLRSAKDPLRKSSLFLEEARTYWAIGLFDDAFDAAERSIGADRSNTDAGQYLSNLFAETKRPWAVRRVQRIMAGWPL